MLMVYIYKRLIPSFTLVDASTLKDTVNVMGTRSLRLIYSLSKESTCFYK